MISTLQKVELPYHNPESWKKPKHLYLQLETAKNASNIAILFRKIFRESGNGTERQKGLTLQVVHATVIKMCGPSVVCSVLLTPLQVKEKRKLLSVPSFHL